jgi:hypothetical protein
MEQIFLSLSLSLSLSAAVSIFCSLTDNSIGAAGAAALAEAIKTNTALTRLE